MTQPLQFVLDYIEAQRFDQPSEYRDVVRVTDGDLDTLIATLRTHDRCSNYPIKCYLGAWDGKDWAFGFSLGRCSRIPDGVYTGPAIDDEVTITTDRVRASETRGDALDDAECLVTLRNSLPAIIALLEELFAYRRAGVPLLDRSPR